MLRDWTESRKIDMLSADAERFFVRLIMKADDWGCYHASPRLLLVYLFPFKRDLEESSVVKWLNECIEVELLEHYISNGKPYVCITNFKQRLRNLNRKFPAPPSAVKEVASALQMPSACITDVPNVPTSNKLFDNAEWLELVVWMQSNAPVLLSIKQPLTEEQYVRLRQRYSVSQVKELLQAMGNSANIERKNSVYATFNQWAPNQRWSNTDDFSNNLNANNPNNYEYGATSRLKEKVDKAIKRSVANNTGQNSSASG